MLGIDHRHPVETVERHDEAMFARQPKHVADPHQRVLNMGRHHLDVVPVKGNELEFIGANTHDWLASSLRCSCVWETRKAPRRLQAPWRRFGLAGELKRD